jgi:putative SOS response-associated peptidase YedK
LLNQFESVTGLRIYEYLIELPDKTMCGRFALSATKKTLVDFFELDEVPADYHERYNIAPKQPVVVLSDRLVRRLDYFRWGLIPSWAKDESIGFKMINARAETLTEKPSFRAAFRKRRCLIIADGFYEWTETDDVKTPVYIHMKSGEPFAFAGLWEAWTKPDGEILRSCTIITCEPNELMAKYHHRMPVILPKENYDEWLDMENYDPERLKSLLVPYPADKMEAYIVSKRVNNPMHDDPDCIEPM